MKMPNCAVSSNCGPPSDHGRLNLAPFELSHRDDSNELLYILSCLLDAVYLSANNISPDDRIHPVNPADDPSRIESAISADDPPDIRIRRMRIAPLDYSTWVQNKFQG